VELPDLKTVLRAQLFDKDLVQEIASGPNRYTEQLKNSGGNTFSKWSRVSGSLWQQKNTGTFHANGYCTEAQCETVFVTKSSCSHTSFWFCHCTGQIWITSVDSSILLITPMTQLKDHKLYPIIRHLNSKIQVVYLLKQNTSVELQMLWNGCLSFAQ
jgi:hypothetical protein